MRDQLLAKIQAQYKENSKVPPVVGLDEYFEGNDQEECIAPNQFGFGRPSLAEMYSRFKEIQKRPDVQDVLVGIHGDWTEAIKDPEMWPAGENVHIYTTASREEVEKWIEGLEADGAIEGWPYGKHPSAPSVKPGFNVFSVCWD
jgi:hypothetical protein